MITHHMGSGFSSPCGLEPASVYRGVEGAFTTEWRDVDCADCLAYQPRRIEVAGVGGPTPQLQKFYLTFGVQYRREPHPHWPSAHPDGWLEVVAPDELAARRLVMEYIGTRYAFMYDEQRFEREWYPLGMLACITSDGIIITAGGVEPPTRQFGPSDCRYYGVPTNEVVCARIEGRLAEGSDKDAIEALGYEAEHVHLACLTAGLALFAHVSEVDTKVMAGELDYANPFECPVCEVSIP